MSPTQYPPQYPPQPGSSGVKTAVVAGALVALLAFNVSLYFALDHTRTDLSKMHDSMLTEIANLKEATSVTTESQRRSVETLKEELEVARRQANQAAGHAKQEAHGRTPSN